MLDPEKLTNEEIRIAATNLGRDSLAAILDSTLLKSYATESDINALVDEALELGCHICVNESRVAQAVARVDLQDTEIHSKTRISSVVGFPLGACTSEVKVIAALAALQDGADEIDMVANVGLLKDENRAWYAEDINAVATAVADFNLSHGARRGLKVIIETCYLDEDEQELAAKTVAAVGLQQNIPIFVKTSTGFGTPEKGVAVGATIENVSRLRRAVGPFTDANPVAIKAAGGVKNASDAIRMLIAAGGFNDDLQPVNCFADALRIGTSSAAKILEDFRISFEQ